LAENTYLYFNLEYIPVELLEEDLTNFLIIDVLNILDAHWRHWICMWRMYRDAEVRLAASM